MARLFIYLAFQSSYRCEFIFVWFLIVFLEYVYLLTKSTLSSLTSTVYSLLIEYFAMTPAKILSLIIIVAFFGLAILAFQLTNGLSESDSSTELQEAMPALPQWCPNQKLLVIWKELLFACIECNCVSHISFFVHNSIDFPRSHTFCPSVYKCFELCFPCYFRCPAFIWQVFNCVHQQITVIDILASIGKKVSDLLNNLGIRKEIWDF